MALGESGFEEVGSLIIYLVDLRKGLIHYGAKIASCTRLEWLRALRA